MYILGMGMFLFIRNTRSIEFQNVNLNILNQIDILIYESSVYQVNENDAVDNENQQSEQCS